jgi:hypothetical protein
LNGGKNMKIILFYKEFSSKCMYMNKEKT